MESNWLRWAKQLQSISETGLHFGETDYDRERYQQIKDIALGMLASLAHTPIETIDKLFRDGEVGYRTPKVDVRGAVIREDKILLVKERNDERWTLPGGYADVGLSPAENIIKEVDEEAGLHVSVNVMYCLRHKAKHPFDPDLRDFYKLYFLCEEGKLKDPCPGSEVLDAAFFAKGNLPLLSTGRVIEKDIELAFAAHAFYLQQGFFATLFD